MGPTDFTPVVYPFTTSMSMAQNMALAVLFESGSPSMADWETTYKEVQISEFYKSIPSRHDDTKFLCGELDSYYVGAVRSGENWFVGGVNALIDTTVTVDFSFLEEGKKYEAEIFINDASDNQKVVRRVGEITNKSKEMIKMIKNGGFAIRLTPKKG